MQKRRLLTIISLVVAVALVAASGSFVFAQGGKVAGSGKITGPVDNEAKTLTAGGASFPKPLYEKWFSTADSVYGKLTGVQINYQANGSGFGITGISDQTLDFAGSDGAMTDKQLAAAKGGAIVHIPMTLGGVVLIYNIPELAGKDPVKLTAENLIQIYLGDTPQATEAYKDTKDFKPLIKWNDDRLVANNPALKDVDKYIAVVRRADSSGTTNIFTSYLSAVSPAWEKLVGGANSVNWPTGIGGRQNPGVAGIVSQTPYAIGYVEAAYAAQQKLATALVQNKASQFVAATQETVSNAAAGVKLPDDMRIKIVNGDGDKTYPIAGFTWLLVYEKQTDPAKALAVVRLLWWATHDGQEFIMANASDPVIGGYAPLPDPAIKKAEALIAKITVNGKQVLPADYLK
jgi:phosphate transport system substrate-binding protein